MIIDSSYFTKGRRSIFNATSTGLKEMKPQSLAVNKVITDFIDQYSERFLYRVLGGELAEELLADDGGDEKMVNLFDALKEAWADYVMYHILRYSGQKLTIDGVVEIKSANTIISPAVYQANVWNDMVDQLRVFCVKYPSIRVDQCFLQKISSCWV